MWKLWVQQRVKTLMWLLVSNRILTNSTRWKRRIAETSPSCYISGAPEEDTNHIIRDCTTVEEVQLHLLPHILVHRFFSLYLNEWIQWNLSSDVIHSRKDKWQIKFVLTCWWIWRWRNESIFNRTTQSLQYKIKHLEACVEEMMGLWKRFNNLNHAFSFRKERLIGWNPLSLLI